MPSAMPASTASSHPPRNRPYSTTASMLAAPPTAANTIMTVRVCARRRGGCVSSPASDWPIFPISLRGPVAVTSAIPLPRTMRAPEKT
jgi:hypothetical protein